ncbi:MAG: hypothetical protein ABS92_01705 [Thiobacillus sp. SCN 63-374]|nr:MAG: hypothetical protein ABS92_01705 [Thiobacillus sp. SCN 63-374]
MDIRTEITNKIIAAIEAGTPPWRQGWSGGGLAYNTETQKAYQGVNQVLLGIAGYSDPRWMTWRQAKKKGLHVRKGERSTKIIRMVEVERKNADVQKDAEVVGEEKDTLLIMRYYDVFNGSQIDGLESLPARTDSIKPLAVAEAMVDGMKLTGLKVMHGFNGASYSVQEDIVRMPEPERFFNDASYWSVLLHECIHATGSHKRLQRLIPTARFGSAEYAKEELRAELGAAILCSDLHIYEGLKGGEGCQSKEQEHLDNHAAYIASWLGVLKQDKNEIFRAAADAQRACDFIREHAVKVEPKAIPEPSFESARPVKAKQRGPRLG